MGGKIILKTENEIAKMREAGKWHAEMVAKVKDFIKPGVSTWELDQIAFNFCKENDITPIQIGYMNYPCTTCIGINDDAEHCIPNKEKILKDGDIMTFDSVIQKDGWCADAGFTAMIGNVDKDARKLVETTQRALNRAITASVEGNTVGDIGNVIHETAKKEGYDTLDIFVAHGLGRNIHEEPEIPNWGHPNTGPKLKEGMVLALDTMVTEGKGEVRFLKDGWSTKTKDGGRFAFFEHTVVVRKDKAEILTK